MFIRKTHTPFALQGTYLFPYVIGKVESSRLWCITDSTPLTDDLTEESLPNQLFSIIHCLGFFGVMLKHKHEIVESVKIANFHNINMDIVLQENSTGLMSDREDARANKWKKVERVITHAFGLNVI